MEHIHGYDEWKTKEPEGDMQPVEHCDICGQPLYCGDALIDAFGVKWCDDCLRGMRRIL